MKNGKAHRVPLSVDALAVLEAVVPLRNTSDFIFPSTTYPHRSMTSAVLVNSRCSIALADKTLVHGFRTSFRTWASERTDIPSEICAMALAHTIGDAVERVYSRSDLLEKRIELMRMWYDYLDSHTII